MPPAEPCFARDLPTLGEDAITCIGIRVEGDLSAWAEAARPFVTELEQTRAKRFVRPIDSVRHLVGRALARRVLRATTSIQVGDFPTSPLGRPTFPEAPIDFSISHSGDLVWAAFTFTGQVGIDVEEIRAGADLGNLASMLHPVECAELHALAPTELPEAFFRCWARKEAVLKAKGTGLSQTLDSFRVHTGRPRSGWLCPDAAGMQEQWLTQDLELPPGYVGSVAATNRVGEVRAFLIEP